MSHTYTETYALLPHDMKDAVGCIIRLHPDADKNSRSNFGEEDDYVFLLADEKEWHRCNDDRIRLIPLDLIVNKKPLLTHALATMMGYEKIKQKFVCYGMADITGIKL